MARATTEMAAPTEDVWAVLSDGWTYSAWVVGTVKIRDVDAGWPAVGAKLHHAFGAWPLMIQDETEVLECEPVRRLLMQARGWPMGEATVELVLHPAGDHTRVEMYEEPTLGPGRLAEQSPRRRGRGRSGWRRRWTGCAAWWSAHGPDISGTGVRSRPNEAG